MRSRRLRAYDRGAIARARERLRKAERAEERLIERMETSDDDTACWDVEAMRLNRIIEGIEAEIDELLGHDLEDRE